jgi:hypothetical protein
MRSFRLRTVTASIAALSSSASASTTKTPTCATISVSVVKSALGGSPSKPKSTTGSNTLSCNYTTATIEYLFKQTTALFKTEQLAQAGQSVSKIGTAAYSSNLTATTHLVVLAGTVAFNISGGTVLKPAGLAQLETLAKKMVPLV